MINGAFQNKLILGTNSNIDRYIPYIYEVMVHANEFYPRD